MSWAETKTINSNPIVPLDKLILGQKVLVSNDSVLAQIDEDYWFVPHLSGTVRIKYTARMESTTEDLVLIVIYQDGTENEFEETLYSENSGQRVTAYFDINVKKGEKFKVEVAPVYELQNEKIYVCGQVLDANYYDIEEV